MRTDWRAEYEALRAQADSLKQDAFNRLDPRFAAWYQRLRRFVTDHAPVKQAAFEEIRFASDFFLSKPLSEQETINDRIALVCDVDEALALMAQIRERLVDAEKEERIRASVRGPAAATDTTPPPQPRDTTLREVVTRRGFSAVEQEEALEAVARAERALAQSPPDWDAVKRVLKFFLDFDRALAQEIVPLILARLPKS